VSWVRIDDRAREHRKLLKAKADGCWMWACGLMYCNSQKARDGFIPDEIVSQLYPFRAPIKLAARLVSVGLWERVEGGFRVHDYHDYQFNGVDAASISAKRAEAGRAGGIKSGATRRDKAEAKTKQVASEATNPIPSHPIPEENSRAVSSLAHARTREPEPPAPPNAGEFTDPWAVARFLRDRSGGRIELTLLGTGDRDLQKSLQQLAAQGWGWSDLATWADASRVGGDGWEGTYALGQLLGAPDGTGRRPCLGLAKCLETSRKWARTIAERAAERERERVAHAAAQSAPAAMRINPMVAGLLKGSDK